MLVLPCPDPALPSPCLACAALPWLGLLLESGQGWARQALLRPKAAGLISAWQGELMAWPCLSAVVLSPGGN